MIQRNAQTAQATMWREVVRNVRRGEERERCNRECRVMSR
jgi:hypothetical protein